jgi:hypothetical protein
LTRFDELPLQIQNVGLPIENVPLNRVTEAMETDRVASSGQDGADGSALAVAGTFTWVRRLLQIKEI